MPRLFKLMVLCTMIVGITWIIAPGALFGANTIRLECPVDVPTDGDSVGVRVMITNDVALGGFSLGFTQNSPDIEITSVEKGPNFPVAGFGQFLYTVNTTNNTVLAGWINFTPAAPFPVNATEVHLMTLWVQIPSGTPAQCVNFDSVFVPPAGYWTLSPAAGGSVEPGYTDCGTADMSIMGGCSGPTNTAPVVSDIPDQTINEGAVFSTIILDNFVTDAEDADNTIIWTASSASPNGFTVNIDANRIATIAHPGGEFAGSATFTFTATDPGALFATDNATFTVTAVNDPPVVTDIPNQTVAFGGTFTTITLDNFVSDADNNDNQMTWTYSGNTDLTVSIDVNRIATITTPNASWSGSETITFRATDPGSLFDDDAATFTVQPSAAVIVLNDDSLFFNSYQGGPNPAGQQVIITNGGTGALNWNAAETTDWLTLSATSGTAPGNFTASVDIAALGIGRHSADITITSAEATNSPQTVVIVVDIVDDVDILLTPDHLTFNTMVDENPDPQSFTITNASPSGIEFMWGAIETTPWLTLNPTSGTTPSTVDAAINVAGLIPGSYEAQVIVKQVTTIATGILDDEDTLTISLVVDQSTDVDDLGGTLPIAFSLEQNYPNPFNPSTTIEFNLPKPSHVTLRVYNILGQEVAELVNTTLSAGNKRIDWNGTDNNGRVVESGVYFYKISADDFAMTRKMMLLK